MLLSSIILFLLSSLVECGTDDIETITIRGDFKTAWWSVLMIATAVIIIVGILSILLFVCIYQLQTGNLITPSPSPADKVITILSELLELFSRF